MLVFRVRMFSTHRRLSFFSGLFVSDKYHTRKLRKLFGGLLHPFWNHWWSPIGSNWCDLFTNRTIVCFCIFFAANEEATLKTKQPSRFQSLFKITDQIAEKILQLLFPKLLLFPPKMDEFSDRLSTASIKYLN